MEITLFNVITWIAGGLVTCFVTYNFRRQERMEKKHDDLEGAFRDHVVTVSRDYVTRSDYREDLRDIKEALDQVRRYIMGDQQR